MSPEDAVALGHLMTGIVGVAFLAAAVLLVALVIPSTRAVIVNWAGRGELSDDAHGELSQIRPLWSSPRRHQIFARGDDDDGVGAI